MPPAAAYVNPSAAAARVWLAWGNLNNGGNAGLACANLNNGLGNANWDFAAGAHG